MAETHFVNVPKLEVYQEQFKEFLFFERKNGILQVRMHTKGGPFKWSFQAHRALAEAWTAIGHDLENEVLILTATDPYWIGEFDMEAFKETEAQSTPDLVYNVQYHDATKIVENFIFDIDIPTIAAINGPGLHTEMALLSDITLCTPDFVLRDDHFSASFVPGDCQFLCMQMLLGVKRASYSVYLAKGIDAQTCLELGVVNEVLPNEKLLPRAWEIAEEIMKKPRVVRRLTSQLTRRPWKRMIMDDYQVHIGHEMYSIALYDTEHDFEKIKEGWTEGEKHRK
jgi:enoyl-CoA hydratase/carnithine racemase